MLPMLFYKLDVKGFHLPDQFEGSKATYIRDFSVPFDDAGLICLSFGTSSLYLVGIFLV